MYKLIGKEIVSGEFKGKNYSHLKLYCICRWDSKNPTFYGEKTEILKLKNNVEFNYNLLEVGQTFKVFYDKYGNVTDISIQDI